jgi:hypothetical protein
MQKVCHKRYTGNHIDKPDYRWNSRNCHLRTPFHPSLDVYNL